MKLMVANMIIRNTETVAVCNYRQVENHESDPGLSFCAVHS
jgi:hypothetical protein